jgi:hypothetical protein
MVISRQYPVMCWSTYDWMRKTVSKPSLFPGGYMGVNLLPRTIEGTAPYDQNQATSVAILYGLRPGSYGRMTRFGGGQFLLPDLVPGTNYYTIAVARGKDGVLYTGNEVVLATPYVPPPPGEPEPPEEPEP